MAYLQDLLTSQTEIIRQQQINSLQNFGLSTGQAYSQFFPTWEVTAPQYQYPVAWSLASLGYKTNEVAYACIQKRMDAISEPVIKVYDKDNDEEYPIDEFYKFLEEPCPDVDFSEFLKATEMYLCIAGFMSWEMDFNNDGSLGHVWPMMPQYCSFMRGQGQLLRAIRYLPYTGLPFYDIQRENVCLFMYADPQYFGLRPLSPTAVMSDIIKVDNDMTTMLQTFIQNGAFVSGILSSEQIINDADARFAKERFRESHGGPNKAGDIVVVGKGLDFKPTNQTLQQMVFPEVDARSETRICMGYSVPPILVSAKSGMDRSTYSNYEQARAAWYEEWVPSEWNFIAKRMTRDLLPHFTEKAKDKKLECRFDTTDIRAMAGIREKQMRWVIDEAKANVVTRDEARIELGYDKIDDTPVFVGITTQQQLQQVQDVFEVGGGQDEIQQGDQTAYAANQEQDAEKLKIQQERLKLDKAKDEEKKFIAMAKRREKEGKLHDIIEFEFKYVSPARQRQLLNSFNVPDPDAEMVLKGLVETVNLIRNNGHIKENIK